MGLGDVAPADPVDRDAVGECLAPLLLQGLALARGEGGEEIVVALVAGIDEVELPVGAGEPAGLGEGLGIFGEEEGRVHRGSTEAPAKLDGGRGEQPPVLGGAGVRAHQQPPARHRRERHRHLELRIVAPAGPLPGVGPGMVEDVFAVGMALEIKRRDGGRAPVRAVEDEMLRQPAMLAGNAARALEGGKEIVGNEGVVAPAGRGLRVGAGVPVFPADLVETGNDRDRPFRHACSRQ